MRDPASHRRIVEAWRTARYAALQREIGWLTLAGLAWLKPGLNTVGSAPERDVVLPHGPEDVGSVEVSDREAMATGAFRHAGRAAERLALTSDADGEPTMLELGSLRLCVIDRGGRLAIRSWDVDATARREFSGIDHWPVDPAWSLEARFEPTPGRTVVVPDVLATDEVRDAPGDVVFAVDGAEHRLQGLRGGERGELWLIFGDATNGTETYGGGRFLYTDAPDADGRVTVDFNRAYNPPCVFSPYATCPLPWPANRLPIRIEAGERRYDGLH